MSEEPCVDQPERAHAAAAPANKPASVNESAPASKLTGILTRVVLAFELIVLFLAALFLFTTDTDPLLAALLVALCTLSIIGGVMLCPKPAGVLLGWSTQVLLLLGGVAVSRPLLVFAIVFGLLWIYALRSGRRIDAARRNMAANQSERSADRPTG